MSLAEAPVSGMTETLLLTTEQNSTALKFWQTEEANGMPYLFLVICGITIKFGAAIKQI